MSPDLKPYLAYRDSRVPWLGSVPAHWQVRRLKHAFGGIIGGSTPSSGNRAYWDGEVPWVTPVDVSRTERLQCSIRRITRDGLASCSARLVPPGTLIITSRAPVGNVALAAIELCTNQGCKALLPNRGVIEPRFGCRVMETLKPELQSLATGTTFTEIPTWKLAVVSIPIPPVAEQSATVRFLDHADRRIRRCIRAKQKLITLLSEQKQAIIHRAVTRGFDPNVRLKPSGVEWLGDVPEHWDVRPAKCLFREVDERSATGEEELLSVSHITGVTPRSQKNISMFMASSNVGHKTCRPGDLVLNTMWAWMAALGVAREAGIVSPSYAVYRPLRGSRLLSDYADLLLRTRPYVSEYLCRSTGIRLSRLRLYPEQFLRIRLVCPPQEEQETILEWVAHETAGAERAILGAQREIELLREYRTRLISDVVTGKFDVREAAARLPEEAEESEPLDDGDVLAADDGGPSEAAYPDAALKEAEA